MRESVREREREREQHACTCTHTMSCVLIALTTITILHVGVCRPLPFHCNACCNVRYESELSRWRSGESVPEKEQASARQLPVAALIVDDITNRRTDSPSSLRGGAGPAGVGGTPSSGTPSLSPVPFATPTPAEARAFEEERTKLYQQIDEKVRRCRVV